MIIWTIADRSWATKRDLPTSSRSADFFCILLTSLLIRSMALPDSITPTALAAKACRVCKSVVVNTPLFLLIICTTPMTAGCALWDTGASGYSPVPFFLMGTTRTLPVLYPVILSTSLLNLGSR